MDLKVVEASFLSELEKIAAALSPEEVDLEAAWKKHRMGLTGGQKLREGLSTVGGGVTGGALGAGAGYLGSHALNRLFHTNIDPHIGTIMGGSLGAGLGLGAGGIIGDVHGQPDVNAGRSLEKYIKKEDKLYGPGKPGAGALGEGPVRAAKELVSLKGKTASPLTEQARAHISKKNFAVSAKASNTGKPAYPIEDKKHAGIALGLAKMHGDSKDIAEVKKDVAAKYPGMEHKTAAEGSGEGIGQTAAGIAGGVAGHHAGKALLSMVPTKHKALGAAIRGGAALAGAGAAGAVGKEVGKSVDWARHHSKKDKTSCMDGSAIKHAFVFLKEAFNVGEAVHHGLAEAGPAAGATLGAALMGGMGKNPLTGAAAGYGLGSLPEMILSHGKGKKAA
jgi:hypothetical protein